jgi:hypothetical protein
MASSMASCPPIANRRNDRAAKLIPMQIALVTGASRAAKDGFLDLSNSESPELSGGS